MISIVRAERLKWKKTFIVKLVWLAPIVAIVLTALLMGGSFFFKRVLIIGGIQCSYQVL